MGEDRTTSTVLIKPRSGWSRRRTSVRNARRPCVRYDFSWPQSRLEAWLKELPGNASPGVSGPVASNQSTSSASKAAPARACTASVLCRRPRQMLLFDSVAGTPTSSTKHLKGTDCISQEHHVQRVRQILHKGRLAPIQRTDGQDAACRSGTFWPVAQEGPGPGLRRGDIRRGHGQQGPAGDRR